VEDLLLDDDLSRILFLVVEVKAWIFGKKRTKQIEEAS